MNEKFSNLSPAEMVALIWDLPTIIELETEIKEILFSDDIMNEHHIPIDDDELCSSVADHAIESFSQMLESSAKAVSTSFYKNQKGKETGMLVVHQINQYVSDPYEKIKYAITLFLISAQNERYPMVIHLIMYLPIITFFIKKYKQSI